MTDEEKSILIEIEPELPAASSQEGSLAPAPEGEETDLAFTGGKETDSLTVGTVLPNFWRIEAALPDDPDGSRCFLCAKAQEHRLLRVYPAAARPRGQRVVASPYAASCQEQFYWDGSFCLLYSVVEGESLSGKTFSPQQLLSDILPRLNEGLRALHAAHMVHGNLSPAAILETEQGVVLDARNIGLLPPHPDYAAPEMGESGHLSSVDYYALGVTLYTLFTGHTPYAHLTPDDKALYQEAKVLPFPASMPQEWKLLIRGLTHRESSLRWGYEQVRAWLDGAPPALADAPGYQTYTFGATRCPTRQSLVRALAGDWEEGKRHLFGGLLAEHFKFTDFDCFRLCRNAQRRQQEGSEPEDLLYWETLQHLAPDIPNIYWMGTVYADLPGLGQALLSHLRQTDDSMTPFWESVTQNSLLSRYHGIHGSAFSSEQLQQLESAFLAAPTHRGKQAQMFRAGHLLSGDMEFHSDGHSFRDVSQLTGHMRSILGPENKGLREFRQFCHGLMSGNSRLNPGLEGWLLAQGQEDALNSWHTAMGSDN